MAQSTSFQRKVLNASKWASLAELTSKLVAPLTNMVLARILAPEAFGIVATIAIVTSFADIFTSSGFQKFLIQYKFKDETEKEESSNVAFISNIIVACFFLLIIIIFRDYLATIVGSPGLGDVMVIASLQLPLTALSSIQTALFMREFDFKTLFKARLIMICIPVLVTIPLAFIGLSYWAIIIGSLIVHFLNALILTIKSQWKPRFFYKLTVLKRMLSFSVWSLVESISIWLTTWVDAFIIASALSGHLLGIYKTSTTMVNSFMALITASVVPVLFSTLSRLQDDDKQFNKAFFRTQRIVSIVVFPLGVGIYLYSDLATQILLGSQWSEASNVIGIWALTSAIVIVLSHFCSEVYRAKGKPKLSFLAQMLHLVVLVPTCIISSQYGFWALVYVRSWVRLEGTFVHFILMKYVLGFPVFFSLRNVAPIALSTLAMGFMGYTLKEINRGIIWDIISIIICIIFYFGILLCFSKIRKELKQILSASVSKH